MKKLAIIRADAGPQTGLGHVTRCATIARELARRGYETRFATDRSSMAYAPPDIFTMEPIEVDAGQSAQAQFDAIRTGAPAADILLVDHYDLDEAFERAARPWCGLLLAIDDFTDRRHDCDVYLNPTIDALKADVSDLLPESCVKLVGPQNAPLWEGFANLRLQCVPRPKRAAKRLLVTLGGSYTGDVILRVLEGISIASIRLELEIVLSGAKGKFAEVEIEAKNLGATVHWNLPHLADIIARADLCIGAGGMTGWERACLGLPALVIRLAENQRGNVAALEEVGAAVEVDGASPKKIADALDSLARDEERLATMSGAAAALCDGRGAARIVDAIEKHVSAPVR